MSHMQVGDTQKYSSLDYGGYKGATDALSKHQRGFDQPGFAQHGSFYRACWVHRQAMPGTFIFLHCGTDKFV